MLVTAVGLGAAATVVGSAAVAPAAAVTAAAVTAAVATAAATAAAATAAVATAAAVRVAATAAVGSDVFEGELAALLCTHVPTTSHGPVEVHVARLATARESFFEAYSTEEAVSNCAAAGFCARSSAVNLVNLGVKQRRLRSGVARLVGRDVCVASREVKVEARPMKIRATPSSSR